MRDAVACLLLISFSAMGAEFQNGQAARAVLGQQSFSSRSPGFVPSSLQLQRNRLYVADGNHRVVTYDVSKIRDGHASAINRTGGGCLVCFSSPTAVTRQSVATGVSNFAVWGKTVAVADPGKHRVFFWRDTASPRADRNPDAVLGKGSDASNIGPATLVSPTSVALDAHHLYVGDAALHRVLVWNSLPVSDDQPADRVIGQVDFESSLLPDSPGPDKVFSPSALASDGVNLFVADSAFGRILVFSPGDLPLDASAVVNSASFGNGPFAPGTLISIRGSALSEFTQSAENSDGAELPRSLGGVEVDFDGVALPLLAVSPEQIDAQIPYDLRERTASSLYVTTARANGSVNTTAAVAVNLASVNPAIFAFGGHEPRSAIVLHSNAAKTDASPVTEADRVKPGEVIKLWTAGLGAVLQQSGEETKEGVPVIAADLPVSVPVTALINGDPAEVLSAKLPQGAVGVYEVEVRIPDSIVRGTDAHLVLNQSGISSNTVVIPLSR